MTEHDSTNAATPVIEFELVLPEPPYNFPPAWRDPPRSDPGPDEPEVAPEGSSSKSPYDADANEDNVGKMDWQQKQKLLAAMDQGLENNAVWIGTADGIAASGNARVWKEVGLPPNPWVGAASQILSSYIKTQVGFSSHSLQDAKDNLQRNFSHAEPLVFDLDGDGLELVTIQESNVFFDWDGDGTFERTSWVAADDAILVIDLDLDGNIDQAAELTFAESGAAGPTDLDRLKGYDSNQDGILDTSDLKFGEFRLWRDLNQDGISDAGELVDLATAGVTSINLNGTSVAPAGDSAIYWFDTNGDGIVDPSEVYTDVDEAPPGYLVGEVRDGAYVFHSSVANTVTSTIETYTVALGFDPNGVRGDFVGSDLVITHEDGQVKVFHLGVGTNGETLDFTGTDHSGAFGGTGNDVFTTSGPTNVTFFGGDGDDELRGGFGDDLLIGGSGADIISGGAGNDLLLVDADDLTAGVSGGSGHDVLLVDSSAGLAIDLTALNVEEAYGGAGADSLLAVGSAGNIVLIGAGGDDLLGGGNGDDLIDGGAGADELSGGVGDDVLLVDGDDLVISGGGGVDTVIVTTDASVSLDVTAASVEVAFGNDGNDVFTATGSADVFLGGGGGNDQLQGGDGNDLFMGDGGADTIIGGDGVDVAAFSGDAGDYSVTQSGSGYVVVDLNSSDGDDGTDYLEGIERLRFADSTIHLDSGNDAPVAIDELWRFRAEEGGSTLAASSLLANDSDADGDYLQLSAIAAVSNGDVSITKDGNVIFKAEDGFSGDARFDYLVTDGHGGTAIATSRMEVFKALPEDQFFEHQWALSWLNLYRVWDDYTGVGVSVVLHDDGVDSDHADLIPNYVDGLDDSTVGAHGTFVVGLVGAARDGDGIVGVAYEASVTMNLAPSIFTPYDDFTSYDVVSNSWTDNATILSGFNHPGQRENIERDAEEGRGGLGTITVFAAGNERALGEDGGQYANQNSRHVITVGAIGADGKIADYSNPGTSLLVVAPGTNIVSTDIRGSGGYTDGSGDLGADYAKGSGTSASAPLVAGVVALMLEANPLLGWRDVQEILAYAAWNSDTEHQGWSTNGATNWNGGGLHVSRDYGFGLVDAHAAVRLAETWLTSNTSENEISVSGSDDVNQAIPDLGSGALTRSITITEDIDIDHVEVTIDLDHTNIGDLVLELRSPDGTTSVLMNRLMVDPGSTTDRGATADGFVWTFSSTHHWGEKSVGDWTLTVRDAATGEIGQLTDWSIRIYGDTASEDDTYIYTAEYGAMTSGVDEARRILSDSAGYDTINAAAVSQHSILDLRAGATSQLAGNSLTIAAGTIIEDAVLGDGDDVVIGNDTTNVLSSGRGNDVLEGGAGSDTLDGGRGSDTASYAGSTTAVSIDLATGTTSGGDAQGDTLIGIENLEGSAWDDTLIGDAGDNGLLGGLGDDQLTGAGGADLLRGGAGADNLAGGDGDDALIGGVGDDIMDGGDGSDTAYFSGARDDYTILTVGGITTVSGADGTDELTGVEFLRFRDETVYVGGGNAAPVAQDLSIVLTQRAPLMLAESAFLVGSSDSDGDTLKLWFVFACAQGLITLTSDNDVRFSIDPDFVGTTSFDFVLSDGKGGEDRATASFTVYATSTFVGTSLDDVFFGLGSADTVYGNAGNDQLDGGYGADELIGGYGDDVLIGGAGSDILSGGDGADTASYALAATGVVIDLAIGSGTGGEANGDTFVSIENVAGSAFADTLTGDGGDNEMGGGAGDDVIAGAAGTDTLRGDSGNDTLIGGDDDDQIFGDAGSDILRGSAGADALDGGSGIDVASYLDAASAVAINLKTGSKAGADAAGDIFTSIEGLEGSAFADQLTGDDKANVLSGADGDDTLTGLNGSDTYHYAIGEGADTLIEGFSTVDQDRLILGAGLTAANIILDRSVSDGDDLTLKFSSVLGSVFVDEQFYNSSGYGIEEIVFGNGQSWTKEDVKSAYIAQVQTSANDTIRGFEGRADTFSGGAGDDIISGYSGSDTYAFESGHGNDQIIEEFSAVDIDRLVLGAGLNASDVILTRTTIDLDDVTLSFSGASGSIKLDEQFNRFAGYGIEEIVFGDQEVWTKQDLKLAYIASVQTSADDTIHGFEGTNDVFEGGSGNDTISGYSGSDTYVYNSGDGADTVVEGYGLGDSDRILLGVDLLRSNIIVEISGSDSDDIVLRFTGSSGTIHLDEQLSGTEYGIDEIVFGDNTTWSWHKLKQVVMGTAATSGNDFLYGIGGFDDAFQGVAGDDHLYGYSGSDTYTYDVGDGADTIFEAANSGDTDRVTLGVGITTADIVVVRSSSDPDDVTLQISGTSPGSILLDEQFATAIGSGIEEIAFADGTIWTTDDIKAASLVGSKTSGNDTVRGFDGRDDVLDGGAGNDLLYGYAGSDAYVFNGNDGADTIFEGTDGVSIDQIVSGAGLLAQDLIVERSTNDQYDMIVRFFGATGSITIDQQFHSSGQGIEQLVFGDGGVLSREGLFKAYGGMSATSGDDTFQSNGSWARNYFYGKGGDDIAQGSSSWEYIYYDLGDGHDHILDNQSSILILGSGIGSADVEVYRNPNDSYDTVIAFSDGGTITLENHFNFGGVDEIQFADGEIWTWEDVFARSVMFGTAGQDELVGTIRDDIIKGLGGDDTLEGDSGSDTYVYTLGDGNDFIVEDFDAFGQDTDKLVLHGIQSSDVLIGRLLADVMLYIVSTGEVIALESQHSAGFGIEQVLFDSGEVWTREYLTSAAAVIGTNGDDVLSGTASDDLLIGRLGDDDMAGGEGSDTYEYHLGDGSDLISEAFDNSGSDVDELVLAGIEMSDVFVGRNLTDFTIEILSTGDVITVRNQAYGGFGVERVVFDGGVIWTRQDLAEVAALVGTVHDDYLSGAASDDWLIGLAGDDYLSGDAGSDTYEYRAGDGNDTIRDVGSNDLSQDTLKLTDLLSDEVVFAFDGQNLVLEISTSGDRITIEGQFGYQLYPSGFSPADGVEQIVFGDGLVWDREQISDEAGFVAPQLTITGTVLDDELFGDYWHNEIWGLGGNDTIYGGAGSDTVDGGDGADTISGGVGDDVIIGGAGNDELNGDDGFDEIEGSAGDGDDNIDGGADYDIASYLYIETSIWVDMAAGTISGVDTGNDTIIDIEGVWTGAGNDTLLGNSDDNDLFGGAGNDILSAGEGADYLRGDIGDDVYQYSVGHGEDLIDDWSDVPGSDKIVFGAGILPSAVIVSRDGYNVILTIGAGDSITIREQLTGAERSIEEVHFADSTIWTAQDIREWIIAAEITTGDDYITGTGFGDSIIALGGNDTLDAGEGDDLLVGGAGADNILGGGGVDTASYATAAGGVYVHLGWVETNLGDAAGDTYDSIENVTGSDFNDTIIATYESNVIRGLGGDDALSGLEGNDTIYGGDGVDQIYGDQGDDLLFGGDGNDIIFGYEDNDTLIMGNGDDYGIGGEGEDSIEGGDGDDELHGHEDSDVLDGGAGADFLFGDEGSDRIVLGGGDDFTLGGTGNDTFVISSGDGGDTIGDFAGGSGASDLIEFRGLGISSFGQLQTYMSEWNGNTYIDFDEENFIVLEGVTMNSLSQDDFLFV